MGDRLGARTSLRKTEALVPTLLLRGEVAGAAQYVATMLRPARVPPDVWALVLEYTTRIVDPTQARPLLRRASSIEWRLPVLNDHKRVATIRGCTDARFLQMEFVGPSDRTCHRDMRLDRFIVRFLRTLEREHLVFADEKLLTYDGIHESLESMAEGWIMRRSTLLRMCRR